MSLFKPGANCWRVENASRAACLIDSESYFKAFKQAAERATRSLIIVGWDIDSRTRLVRSGGGSDDRAVLGNLLNAIVREKKDLEIRILIWDYALVKMPERELWLNYKLGWKTHPRISFQWDEAPLGASHHQKVVVIDDQLAFSGGIDLSKWRWDTSGHIAGDARRVDPSGEPYKPYHDVQMMVEGDIAKALGDLARMRWHRATGQKLTPPPADLPTAWPEEFEADFKGVPVAISRTDQAFLQQQEVREVEALYLDAIGMAKQSIYIENQYTTSHSVGDALMEKLKDNDGPEVIIVTHFESDGWLEQNTMDVLRSRWLSRLRQADHHNRLRIYYPHLPGYRKQNLTVHTKVMVVDGNFLRVGSSNLCNRSMGLDTECDLALEAEGNPQVEQGIVQFRNRLLAEHTGLQVGELDAVLARSPSLGSAINGLSDNARSLKSLDSEVSDWRDRQVPHSSMIDPEKPVDIQWFRDQWVPQENTRSAVWLSLRFIFTIMVLLGMAAAWRWTPLSQIADLSKLLAFVNALEQNPLLPVFILGGFIFGGCLGMPVTLMVSLIAFVYNPWKAFALSYSGTMLSASLSFWLGNLLGTEFIDKYAGNRVRKVSRTLARQGVVFIALLRLLPIAPFAVINMVGGASHVKFRDFFLGTLIGAIPGTFAVTFFVDQLALAAQDPRPRHFFVASAIGLVFVGMTWLFSKWVRRSSK